MKVKVKNSGAALKKERYSKDASSSSVKDNTSTVTKNTQDNKRKLLNTQLIAMKERDWAIKNKNEKKRISKPIILAPSIIQRTESERLSQQRKDEIDEYPSDFVAFSDTNGVDSTNKERVKNIFAALEDEGDAGRHKLKIMPGVLTLTTSD